MLFVLQINVSKMIKHDFILDLVFVTSFESPAIK